MVDRRHVFRNALLPVTTIIGLQFGILLSGAVLTETVFAIPGMGSWMKEAIFNHDYPVLQGGILFLALVFVIVNLIVDISYGIHRPADQGELMSVAEIEEVTLEHDQPAERAVARRISALPTQSRRDRRRRLRQRSSSLIAVFAPLLAPYSPTEQNLFAARERLLPGAVARPSRWDVDELGRDEFSRVMYGARYSLVIGVVSVAVGLSIGLLLGSIAGYFGGWRRLGRDAADGHHARDSRACSLRSESSRCSEPVCHRS